MRGTLRGGTYVAVLVVTVVAHGTNDSDTLVALRVVADILELERLVEHLIVRHVLEGLFLIGQFVFLECTRLIGRFVGGLLLLFLLLGGSVRGLRHLPDSCSVCCIARFDLFVLFLARRCVSWHPLWRCGIDRCHVDICKLRDRVLFRYRAGHVPIGHVAIFRRSVDIVARAIGCSIVTIGPRCVLALWLGSSLVLGLVFFLLVVVGVVFLRRRSAVEPHVR